MTAEVDTRHARMQRARQATPSFLGAPSFAAQTCNMLRERQATPSSCGTELEYSARATGHAVAVGRGTNILTSVAFSGAHEGLASLCSPACIIITIIIFSIITITVISSVTNATGHAVAEWPV